MRPWKFAGVLLLCTGLGGLAWAQPMTRGGRPTGAPHPRELFDLWLNGGAKTKAPANQKEGKPKNESARSKPAEAAKPKEAGPQPERAERPSDKAADRFQREQRAFLRRLAVCDRLRQVALQTDDDDLLRRADELQEQAWSLCLERTGMVPVDEFEASSPADEEILDQRLGGAESRATRVDRLYTVPAANESRRSLAREE
jgi:hypothetical protein